MKRLLISFALSLLVSSTWAAPVFNYFPPPQMAYNPSTYNLSVKVTAGNANLAANNNYVIFSAQQVIFTGSFGTVTGLTAGTIYYVVASTNTTFQVSATVGGAAITPGGSGSATLTVASAAPALTVGDQVTAPPGVTTLNMVDGGTGNGEALYYDDFLNISFAGMTLPPGTSVASQVIHFCAQGGSNGSCLEINGASNEHSIIGQTGANGSFTYRVPDSLSGDLATIGAIAASALTQEIDGMITCTPTTGFIDTGGTGGFATPITGAPHVPGCTFRVTPVTGTTNGNLVFATYATFAGMIFSSDQGLEWGLPTGGDKGHGTINALGLFTNGVPAATTQTGTFTITYTGMTAGVTGTAVWTLSGSVAKLFFPAAAGTSNATTFTATGLPAAIQPTRTQDVFLCDAEDSGASTAAVATFTAASGTVTLSKGFTTAGAWTNTGAKGIIGNGCTVGYLTN